MVNVARNAPGVVVKELTQRLHCLVGTIENFRRRGHVLDHPGILIVKLAMEKWVDIETIFDPVPQRGKTARAFADELQVAVIAPLARYVPFVMGPVRILHTEGAR